MPGGIHRITRLGPLAAAVRRGQSPEGDLAGTGAGTAARVAARSLSAGRADEFGASAVGRSFDGAASMAGNAARMPAPPSGAQRPVVGDVGPGVSPSAATRASGVQLRRSSVTSLPVSGSGSMAAGVATSVAGDIARDVVEAALTQRFEQSSTAAPSGFVSREAPGRVQRAVADADAVSEPDLVDEDAQQDQLLRFAMSDAFEERLMEFLQDRLLGEIERRGGRYGGGFA